jgi:hypothetical protein
MISPTTLAAVEDVLRFLNPARMKENVRHLRSGLLSPFAWEGISPGFI